MLSRVLPASRQTCHIRHIVHELEFCTRQLLSSSRLTCPEHISRHARYLSKRRYATITSIPSHASSSHIHAARSSPAASSSQGHQVTTTSSKLTFDEYSSTVRARQSPDISEPPCMGTALALDPNTTTLVQLLDRLPRARLCPGSSHRSRLTFFVTPSFAARALASPRMLLEIIDPKTRAATAEIDVLVAVVDRLPRPSHWNICHVRARKYFDDIGEQGIAFVHTTQPTEHVTPTQSALPATSGTMTVSFRVSHSAMETECQRRKGWNRPGRDLHFEDYDSEIQLANTTFVTGTKYVLTLTSWLLFSGQRDPVLKSTSNLDSCNLVLPFALSTGNRGTLSTSLPLLPLTQPMMIAASMGNIVRQLLPCPSADTLSSAPVPASQDLEAKVAEYFTATASPQRQVKLWALITDTESDSNRLTMDQSWTDATVWTHPHARALRAGMSNVLCQGGHFARVISGGGGWGKKAGLVCLDPSTMYEQDEQRERLVRESDDATDADLETLSNLSNQDVLKGKYIRFFIAPPERKPSRIDERLPLGVSCATVELGVIPSTMDNMPETTTSSTEEGDGIRVYKNHFGAMTDTSMVQRVHRTTIQDSGRTLRQTGGATKIDVPFARMNYCAVMRNVGGEMDEGKSLEGALGKPSSEAEIPLRKVTDERTRDFVPRFSRTKKAHKGE